MKPRLSIVIPVLNDNHEVNVTIRSIRLTSPREHVEIIVVDDCSDQPVVLEDKTVHLMRNMERRGAGSSRHIGALAAQADYLLLLDSHMRFEPGWFEEAMMKITGRSTTVHCAACLGLDEKNMDVFNPYGAYAGARLNIYGPHPHKKEEIQIFEGVWADNQPGDDYEISCLMGACYFVPRAYFFYLGGLIANKHWGSEEPYLALKAYLAGGNVRLLKTVRVGHKFRSSSPYKTKMFWINYNKVRSFMTTMNADESKWLISKFHDNADFQHTLAQIKKDQEEIEKEFYYNQSIFKHDLEWYCKRFSIKHPLLP